MNWKTFKEEMKKLGVTDYDELSWIDWNSGDKLKIFGKNVDGSYEISGTYPSQDEL